MSGYTRVLLTGGSGLVGKKVAELLRDRYEVVHFEARDPDDGLPWIRGELRDSQSVERACRDVDAIVHVAALHGRTWDEAGDHVGFETNVMGTFNILEGARKGGAKRVVFTSSTWATGHSPVPRPYLPVDEDVPGEPLEPYGLTKKLGEQMCRFFSEQHGFSTICLRPGGISPEDAPLSAQFGFLFGGVDVRDVAQAHALAVAAPEEIRHETINTLPDSPLCTVDPTQFLDDPVGCLEALRPGVRRLIEGERVRLSLPAEWFTIDKARELLGYCPQHNFEVPLEAEGDT